MKLLGMVKETEFNLLARNVFAWRRNDCLQSQKMVQQAVKMYVIDQMSFVVDYYFAISYQMCIIVSACELVLAYVICNRICTLMHGAAIRFNIAMPAFATEGNKCTIRSDQVVHGALRAQK